MARAGGRVWLRFGAAATDCRVWVNGRAVGEHVGDYLPFDLDVTEALGGQERCDIVCRVDELKGSPPAVVGRDPWNGHITKGFHDVLSLQHGGIWCGVTARETGPVAIEPDGLAARADAATGEVVVLLDLHPHESGGSAEVVLVEPGTGSQQRARAAIEPGQRRVELRFTAPSVHPWSPEEPTLGAVHASVWAPGRHARDEATARFAFRSVQVGGADNRRILLNGRPLLLRGMLEWEVEHEHIAPSPTREELLVRFRELRERGFNCVCLCMVYPPEHYYDVADETGMLLWQIHPVWKSSMAPRPCPSTDGCSKGSSGATGGIPRCSWSAPHVSTSDSMSSLGVGGGQGGARSCRTTCSRSRPVSSSGATPNAWISGMSTPTTIRGDGCATWTIWPRSLRRIRRVRS
ncbi:MAG: hypothetical protein IPJ41_09175 [Phycisphaerales bacterium]|nr:hypothetical protein [Phycisphaerales bacterium]